MRGDAKSGMYVGGEKRSLGFSLSIPRKKKKERRIPLSSLFYRSYLRFFSIPGLRICIAEEEGISFPSQLNRIYELSQARPLA